VCEKSHTISIGSMGDKYNHLEEVCELRKEEKGEEIVWVWTTVLHSQVFVHVQQVEREERAWSWNNHGK
jgi:hypothetical protein